MICWAVRKPSRSRCEIMGIPLWLPFLIFGATTGFIRTVSRVSRRKRRKLGLCLKCGYDLRGSSERCPECGVAIELDKAAQLRENIIPKENEIDETNPHDHNNGGRVERGG